MFVFAVIKIQIYTNENKACNLVLKIMINHMAIKKGFKIFHSWISLPCKEANTFLIACLPNMRNKSKIYSFSSLIPQNKRYVCDENKYPASIL